MDFIFDKEYMWIQLHNIPLSGMTSGIGEKIGRMIGEVVEVDVNEGIGWGPYLRVQVAVNITKPLLTMNGSKVWISFLYERLPTFCFRCVIYY